jgi:hypothetical protein
LEFVTRTDPGIEASAGLGMATDEGIGGGPRDTDLTGFFYNLQLSSIVDPMELIREEEGIF